MNKIDYQFLSCIICKKKFLNKSYNTLKICSNKCYKIYDTRNKFIKKSKSKLCNFLIKSKKKVLSLKDLCKTKIRTILCENTFGENFTVYQAISLLDDSLFNKINFIFENINFIMDELYIRKQYFYACVNSLNIPLTLKDLIHKDAKSNELRSYKDNDFEKDKCGYYIRHYQGKIINYNKKRKFGFINYSGGNIFFHDIDTLYSVKNGDIVNFLITFLNYKKKAIRIYQ